MNTGLQLLLLLAGAIVTTDSAIRVIRTSMDKTVRKHRVALDRLGRLAAHVHVDYFSSVLGPPIFVRPWTRDGDKVLSGWIERVWVDPHYFVQALSDQAGMVGLYSVTSRTATFKPEVPFPNHGIYTNVPGEQVKATLNVTPFAKVGYSPTQITADRGNHRMGYVEIYYFGNPGNYQYVALSVSDAAGSVGEGFPNNEVRSFTRAPGINLTEDQVPAFRATEAPNTFTISAPLLDEPLDDFEALSGAFGADAHDVRVFA